MRRQFDGLDETTSRLASTVDAETEDGPCSLRIQPGRQLVIRMSGVGRMLDPRHGVVSVQHLDHPVGVVDMTSHAYRESLDALQQVEGVGRTHARTKVAQALGPGPHGQRRGTELLGEGDAVVPVVGL